jgi:U3 small nucleolar RNA-associated protein 20
MEEPNRQAAVFGLLRAIVSRKFVVVEIYDIMGKVAEIMLTNQSSQVQEQSRVVLLQFLLDYPQGKGRLQTQMTFLAKNLSYVFESGRRSVMELLSAIFIKFDTALLRDYADLFFVALVMVMANDDSSKCREMAAELIKALFTQLDAEHRKAIVSHLHMWSTEKSCLQLSRVSAQVYGVIVDTLNQDITPYTAGILDDMNAAIRVSSLALCQLESGLNDQSDVDIDVEWQLPYHALNAITKVFRVRP